MKLKSSPSGAPCCRMRWASSNSEFLFNSSCPRMAEILAGERRNTRASGGPQLDESDTGAKTPETSFGGVILLALSKGSIHDCIQSLVAIRGISIAVKDKIPFRAWPMLATLVGEPFHEPGWVYEEKYDGIHAVHGRHELVYAVSRREQKTRFRLF